MWWGLAMIVGGLLVGLSICGIFGDRLAFRSINTKTATYILFGAFASIVLGIIVTLVGAFN